MFESGDDAALAARLAALLSDRPRAARMGLAGQEWVRRHHDVSIMAGAYHRHYASLLGRDSVKASSQDAPASALEGTSV
jgi:glycosyltransferase involved in cell wall biosynthesis